MSNRTFTYQTRIVATPEQSLFLDRYAEIYNTVQRHMFAEIVAGKTPDKAAYLRKFLASLHRHAQDSRQLRLSNLEGRLTE